MATLTTRRTILANPAPRRARPVRASARAARPGKRRLTPAQIKYFGTPRQKAALRRAGKRVNPGRRNISIGMTSGFGARRTFHPFRSAPDYDPSRVGESRPKRKRKSTAKGTGKAKRAAARTAKKSAARKGRKRTAPRTATKKRTRSNPGEIITLSLNPAPATTTRRKAKKGTSKMARARKHSKRRRRNPSVRRRRRHTVSAAPRRRRARRMRSNPVRGRRRSSVRRRSRRNPIPGGGQIGGFLQTGLWAIGGAVGSKLLTQAVLGSANTGWMGYAANLSASFALGAGVKAFMRNQQAGNAVILGGVIQTLLRVLIDRTPFGSKVSNLGMGDYLAQNYLVPQRLVSPSSAALVPPVVPMAAPAGGMGALRPGRLF